MEVERVLTKYDLAVENAARETSQKAERFGFVPREKSEENNKMDKSTARYSDIQRETESRI